jgi:hypothetical protein
MISVSEKVMRKKPFAAGCLPVKKGACRPKATDSIISSFFASELLPRIRESPEYAKAPAHLRIHPFFFRHSCRHIPEENCGNACGK